MSILKIGGSLRRETNLNKLNNANSGDQVFLKGPRFDFINQKHIFNNLTLSGKGINKTGIYIPEHSSGILFSGTVILSDLTINVPATSAGLIFDNATNVILNNVRITYSGKFTRVSDHYSLLQTTSTPMSSFKLINSIIESAYIVSKELLIENSIIGHPFAIDDAQSYLNGKLISNNNYYINTILSTTGTSHLDTYSCGSALSDVKGYTDGLTISNPYFLPLTTSLYSDTKARNVTSIYKTISKILSDLKVRGRLKKDILKNNYIFDDVALTNQTVECSTTITYDNNHEPYPKTFFENKSNTKQPILLYNYGNLILRGNINQEIISGIDYNIQGNGTLSLDNYNDINVWLNAGGTISNINSSVPGLVEKQETLITDEGDILPPSFSELNDMIGLDNVKKTLTQFISESKTNALREKNGLPTHNNRHHLAFVGNPGTAKTTVARLVGKILYESGMLKSPELIETSPTELIKGYVGQSGQEAHRILSEIVDKGGVMFIDEAYGLISRPDSGKDDFANAIQTALIKRMEDNYKDFIVIFAGYPDEIDELFKQNDGFRSRVSNIIKFEDYTDDELISIFDYNLSKSESVLVDDAKGSARRAIENFIKRAKFNNLVDGNGRWVANLFASVTNAQTNRIKKIPSPTYDDLIKITTSDIMSGATEFYNSNK